MTTVKAQPFVAGIAVLTSAIVASALLPACGGARAVEPRQIEEQYGVAGAYTDNVPTPDGRMKGTLVPVTLADGRTAQLFIPAREKRLPHTVYLRDDTGLYPVQVNEDASRDEVVRHPTVVQRKAQPAHALRRSWEQEALIVGGSAGAGTAIGALSGGKKGAAIGATAGGIGGLIYDLATRDKK